MAALMRCAHYPRLISRSLGISKGTIAEICTVRKCLTFRTSQVTRFPTVVSCSIHTSRHFSVPATDKKLVKDVKEAAAYPEDYPASEFWRRFNFTSLRMQESTYEKYLLLMETRLREGKGFSAVEFYYLMKLTQEQDSFLVDEAIILLMTTGFQNKHVDQVEKNKWTNYLTNRFKALGVKLDPRYYSEMLYVYEKNQNDYSPVDFLAQIEADGISPNRLILSRLIQRYCVIGDMKSATQILDYMKQSDLPISLSLYNHLIRGHFNAGDTETAMKMFEDTKLVGFEPDSGTYYSAIVGYALQEDMPNVKRLLAEAQEKNILMSDGVYSSLIEQVGAKGLTEFAEYFLLLLKAGSTYYYNESHDTIKILMTQGNYDLAYKYFEGLSDPAGRLFFNPAIIAKMPVEEMIKYSQKMRQQGYRLSNITDILECALQKFDYETGVEVLPYLEKEGEEFRNHYTWPFICYYRDMKCLDGMKKLLPMCAADYPTILDYLNPALISMGLDVNEYQTLLKEHSSFSDSMVNTCTLTMAVQKDGLEAGMETVEKLAGFEVMKDFGKIMPVFIMKCIKNGEDWKTGLQLLSAIEEKMKTYLNPHTVVMAAARQIQASDKSLTDLADCLAEMDITIDKQTAQMSGLAGKVSEQELDNITFKAVRATSLDTEQMEKMSNKELERLLNPSLSNPREKFFVRNFLIRKHYLNKDWKSLESLMMQFDISSVYSPRHLEILALYYLYQKTDVNKAAKCLMNKKGEVDYRPKFHLVYNTAVEVAKAGQYEDAKALISMYKDCELQDKTNVRKCTFFDRDSTPENVQEAHEMFDLLVKNGYMVFLNNRDIVNAYSTMVAKSCDTDEICMMIDKLTKMDDVNLNLVAIFAPAIQHNDKACLQKVFNHLSTSMSEKKLLISLSAAFLQEGKDAQARKVLVTPGLSCIGSDLKEFCTSWYLNAQTELLEKFYNAVKDLRGVDKKRVIFWTFLSMCKESPVKVVDCVAFFDTKFEEEGVFADISMLRYYARFLKHHKMQDHPACMRYLNEDFDREATANRRGNRKQKQGTSVAVETDLEAAESPVSVPTIDGEAENVDGEAKKNKRKRKKKQVPVETDKKAEESPVSESKGDQELQGTSEPEVSPAADSTVSEGSSISAVSSDSNTYTGSVDSETDIAADIEMQSSVAEETKPVEVEIKTAKSEELKTKPEEELKDDSSPKDDSISVK